MRKQANALLKHKVVVFLIIFKQMLKPDFCCNNINTPHREVWTKLFWIIVNAVFSDRLP